MGMTQRTIDGAGANSGHETTPLAGRQSELGRLRQLVEGRGRLITITGPCGVGKTRLARELVRSMERSAGLARIELACLEWAVRPDVVASVLAQQLGVDLGQSQVNAVARELAREVGRCTEAELEQDLGRAPEPADVFVDQVGMALEELGPALLVLDDLAPLRGLASQTVGRLLDVAPSLCILVTSRQPLGLAGESCLELAPLGEDDARQLFNGAHVAAAGRVCAETVAEQATVTRLVRELEGLPRAIELCAQQVAAQGLDTVRRSWNGASALHLLPAAAGADGAARSSLRRSIDRSWWLLAPALRRALCACALFCDEIPASGVRAVLGGEHGVAALLRSLRRWSLLCDVPGATEGAAEPERWQMLRCVRAYAREQLAWLDQETHLRQRYALYMLRQGERWAGLARRDASGEARRALELALDDLFAAWGYFLTCDPRRAVRVALVIHEVRGLTGPYDEHRRMLDVAVAVARQHLRGELLQGQVLLARAESLMSARQSERAAEDLAQVKQLAGAPGADALQAEAERMLGVLLRDQGAFAEASEHLEQAAVQFTRLRDDRGLGRTVANLGTLNRQRGRPRVARACFERALGLLRQAGDPWVEGHVLAGLGHLAAAAGERRVADKHFAAALELLLPLGDRRTVGLVFDAMATLALERGQHDQGLDVLEEARAQLTQVGDTVAQALVDTHRGVALAVGGRTDLAWDLLRRAARPLERAVDPRLCASAAASWGCLWAAEADLAERQGDRHTAEELRCRARRSSAVASVEQSTSRARDLAAHEEFAAQARRLLQTQLRGLQAEDCAADEELSQQSRDKPTIRVGGDGRWVRLPDGTQIDLSRTPLLAQLVLALALRAQEDAHGAVSADELTTVLWPDEAPDRAVALNRLYVAIAKLRRRGLEGVLVRQAGGYAFRPSLACDVERAAAAG